MSRQVTMRRSLEIDMADLDRFRGCLPGLAIGDALGSSLEFRARGTFAAVTDQLLRLTRAPPPEVSCAPTFPEPAP